MSFWFWTIFIVVFVFGFVVFRGAPYLPSHRRYAKRALTNLYHLNSEDVLVDLGSGDGIILRLAADKGARAIGYELNPLLVLVSRLLARGDERQTTYFGDMWFVDFPKETTVVYVFSVSRDSKKLADKLRKHVDSHKRTLWCITYGAGLAGMKPIKKLNAHNLYVFEP